MRRRFAAVAEVVMLTIALVAATAVGGWWGVGLAAFVWGAWTGRDRAVAAAAVCAWGSVLVWTAGAGALGRLIAELGQVAMVPGWVLVVATLVFPAVLAWSAAVVGGGVTERRKGERRERRENTTATETTDHTTEQTTDNTRATNDRKPTNRR